MSEQNIRELSNQELTEILLNLLEKDVSSSYDNEYVGKVVDNDDGDMLGRCKIRVFGVFGDDVQDVDLPWALPIDVRDGVDCGSFIVPENASLVRVEFERGEINQPRYSKQMADYTNLPPEREDDYPNTMVLFKTPNNVLTINRTTGALVYSNGDGDIKIDVNDTESNGLNVEVSGNVNLESDDNINISGKSITKNGVAGITAPTGAGPLCGLPNCLFTGSIHQTDRVD